MDAPRIDPDVSRVAVPRPATASVAAPDPAPSERQETWPIVAVTALTLALLAGGAAILAARGAPGTPEAPSGVVAVATTCAPPRCARIRSTVTLRWNAPGSGSAVSSYRILRNGAALADGTDVPAGATTFVDDSVRFGGAYLYEIVTVSGDRRSEGSVPAHAAVPLPPPAAAQLNGTYRVQLDVLKAGNVASLSGIEHPVPGSRTSTEWTFEPICPANEGRCPARWLGAEGVVHPAGRRWAGTLMGPEAECVDGTRVPTSVSFALATLDARGDAELGWSVAAFEGTALVTFRCPASTPSHGKLEIVARLV